MKGILSYLKVPAGDFKIEIVNFASLKRSLTVVTAMGCTLAGFVQTAKAQTVEYDFASGKFSRIEPNGSKVGIDGGATINTKEGSTINVRVVNLNKEMYKATITAKEIPSPSQSVLDTIPTVFESERVRFCFVSNLRSARNHQNRKK